MHRVLGLVCLIFPLLLLTACGSSSNASSHTPTVSIESQYQSYVSSFTDEAANQGARVTITDLVVESVPSLSGNAMGICQTDPTGATSPTIMVSQEYWNTLDSTGQEELLFHELGHCVLGRIHLDTLSGGLPTSMMNGVFMGSSLYGANRSQFLHELFTKTNLGNAFPLVVPWNALLPNFAEGSNS